MPDRQIPEHIDPFRYAEQHINLTGTVNLHEMQRLSNMLPPGDQALAKVTLQFGVDEQKVTYIKGHLETTIILQCQRCLDPFNYEIITNFILGIVHDLEEANTLPEQYEPALTKEGGLALRELIEDEIILNLPIIPRHEPDQCKVQLPYVDSVNDTEKSQHPFKVLESLKQQGKQKGQDK